MLERTKCSNPKPNPPLLIQSEELLSYIYSWEYNSAPIGKSFNTLWGSLKLSSFSALIAHTLTSSNTSKTVQDSLLGCWCISYSPLGSHRPTFFDVVDSGLSSAFFSLMIPRRLYTTGKFCFVPVFKMQC